MFWVSMCVCVRIYQYSGRKYIGFFSRRRKFLMNFCRNFVEICAFCIGFASGTASTRACRVDQLNIKQQCAATREQLFTFSLDVVRGCRRQEQSEPLEGDRWQEQLTTARGFGAWGAQWHVDLLRWLLCPIGKGKNSWKGLGSSVCKRCTSYTEFLQNVPKIRNKGILTSFDVGRWNFQVVSCGQSNASVKCHVNVMCESCVNRVRLASRMTVEGQKASRESQF